MAKVDLGQVVPTIAVASGSHIGTVGTPSVQATTSGTTTTFTFDYLKGAKGSKGSTGATGATGADGVTPVLSLSDGHLYATYGSDTPTDLGSVNSVVVFSGTLTNGDATIIGTLPTTEDYVCVPLYPLNLDIVIAPNSNGQLVAKGNGYTGVVVVACYSIGT